MQPQLDALAEREAGKCPVPEVSLIILHLGKGGMVPYHTETPTGERIEYMAQQRIACIDSKELSRITCSNSVSADAYRPCITHISLIQVHARYRN